ncbi:type I secretion system permease/ATPase [Brevundimonas lutea]|uniref:type I secretion system permease/ATPase n=1 Tax=Brevundimonas lutea TaxID=2293980 RepID=UPI000F01FE6F|nr:type I secretion system permease/ATPase [Brevundimonas lutea]
MLKSLLSDKPGARPLAEAIRACRWHLLAAAGFSALVNILYLAPTLYMMQVYDRVVPTGGIITLVLVTIVVFLALGTLAGLDVIRTRLLVRAGLRLDQQLAGRTLGRAMGSHETSARAGQVMREFDQVRSAIGGQGALAILDAPWTPIYLLFCFLLHPLLGLLTLVGALMLFGLAVLNERSTKTRLLKAHEASARAYAAQEQVSTRSEVVRALGMRRGLVARQLTARAEATGAQSEAQFTGGRYSGAIKFLRLMLQSLALGLGAYLAVQQQISAGAIIAASVLLSRAVQPIEQLVGAWPGLVQARAAWKSLTDLYEATGDQDEAHTLLPAPAGRLDLQEVSVRMSDGDTPQLKQVSFALEPGQMLGVIGPSGSGKTTLARVVAGAYRPQLGAVRLDGSEYGQWDPERLARHIGYLPQDSVLFAGTVKDNISRFEGAADPAADQGAIDLRAVTAAKAAEVHDLIQSLPQGYDTPIGPGGRGLSAGQMQRVALARALYGSPRLLVLDEPNSHLDQDGETALMRALKRAAEAGAAIVIVAHRAGVLASADLLLVMNKGAVSRFGPRDQVLQALQGRGGPRIASVS